MSRQELTVLSDRCCPPLTTEALSEKSAAQLARGFKALGDPVRLRLLSLIASRAGGEVCVCELTDAFTQTGPTISHHLKVLREAGLTHTRAEGTHRHVSLRRDELDARFPGLLDAVLNAAAAAA